MIVTRGTIQGDYAEKYDVGLVIDNLDNLNDKLKDYRKGLNFIDYTQKCNRLLTDFLKENETFEQVVRTFVEKSV